MATRIEWSKLGLKLVCETSRRPVPKTEQAFPIPDFGLNGSPLISAVLETVAASGRTGIRVATLAAGLPGSATNGTFWTLIHSAAIGAGLPSLVAYDVEPPTINLLFEAPLGGATHKFHLICSSEGRNTVYPEVSVNTPADEIVSSLGGITDPDTLVPSEKVQIVQDYNVLTGENADLISKAASAGVSSSAYSTAYTALATTYLPTLTSPVLWSSLTGNTALGTGNRVALWNPKWLALRSAAADLKAAIALAAVNTANTASGAASTANSNATTALNNAPVNVNGLPALPNATYPSGKLVYDTVTKRLYRSTGAAWEASTVAAADILGTLTSAQIASLATTKLTGTIGADLLAANSVVAKNLTITNFDNLIPNPNSEQPAPAGGWPAGAYEAIGLTNVGGTSGAWKRYVSAGWYQIAPLVPCAPGDKFHFEAQTLSDNVGSNARIVVDFLNSAGGWLAGGYAYNNTLGWVKKTVQWEAPPNAVFVRFMIGGESAGSHYDEMYARKMMDGNIVVDGTLHASKIVADSITSGQISAGAIGTPELAAGSVTAAKMVVQAASLISDPCFESGPAGWAGHTGLTLPGSGSGGCPGRYYSQFNARDCVSNTGFDVYPGEKFYCQISCHAYGGSGAGGFGMVALGEDRSGTVIYANIVATTTYYADWATISGTLTVPANVVKMRLGPWMDLPYTWVSANGGPLFTNFIVRKMNNAELIVDGAITANKLEADLAMVNTIRSTNYNGNASTQSTVGFKIQGTAFNAKDAYGATQSVQADFAANMLIGGYRAAVITNRVIGNSQVWNTAQTTTWVCPEGITNVELLIVAAGGGGQGSATNNYGGDGGSGGQGIKRRIAVVPGTTYTLVIGTGGAGGTAGGGNGGNGENSSMSGSGFSTITMTGGVGSASSGSGANGGYWNTFDNGSVANGGIGGSGGNIGLGQPPALVGGACWDFGGGDNGNTANSSGPGGGGGASCLAAGGAGGTGAVAGVAGTLGSGGGGGGCSTTAQTAGGRGGDGYIRISW